MLLNRDKLLNRPFWLEKKYILYFWVPRLIVSVLFLFFYKYIHLSSDNFNSETTGWGEISNFNKYINNYKYNPLYALSLQSIYKLFYNPNHAKFILAELISGISCISIYISCKKFARVSSIALLLMAVHPMLALYGSRFCTENFGLASLAIYLATRVEIKHLIISSRNKIKRIQLKSIFKQFLLTLFRAQNITFLIYEQSCLVKDFINRNIKSKFKNKKSIVVGSTYLIIIIIISIILILSLKNYYNILSDGGLFWGNWYLTDPEKIFNFLTSNIEVNNNIQRLIFYISSYLIYLVLAIILLTGARERLIQLSWGISIGGFIFNYNYGGDTSNYNFIDPSNSGYLIDFIVKIVLPLLGFSFLHLIGILQWYRSTRNNGFSISIYPLFICLPPLILLPVMRYFIPLIPISCIGLSIIIDRLLISRRMSI